MKENLLEIVKYIIQFLVGEKNSEYSNLIGYTSGSDEFSRYKLVIIPSDFFEKGIYGTEQTLPAIPLQDWNGIPLLFGKPMVEKKGETTILYADIIASTYFLISRYEEFVNRRERDTHGRFPGIKSLLFRAQFLNRPIVDEYGKELRQILRETSLAIYEPKEKIDKIFLTHDVDQIAHYRNFRGMSGAVTRFFKSPYQTFKALQTYFCGIKHDPWFTFPWLFELANELKNEQTKIESETIVFIKSGGGNLTTDKPLHDIRDKNFEYLFKLCRGNNVSIGLHPSYLAGENPSYIFEEKQILDETIGEKTFRSRNHFLRSREPEDFRVLIEAGFTDDFTMSYADCAGFRLGTCRAVRWIDPEKFEITSLKLHPLTIMDSTLSDDRYMKLRTDEAFSFSKKLIDQVKKHNGELVLLWHNTTVEKGNNLYHRDLYHWIINYLKRN